ncbi:MAG: outer membrane protein [Candidatus Latescibacterota bacterium]
MLKKLVLLTVLLASGVGGVEAQEVLLGPSGGYQRSQDSDGGEFLGGLALRVKATEAFGVEGSILYRQEDFEDGDVTVRSWPVMATALIYPLPFIYGSIGGGWFYTTFDYSDELNDAGTEDDTTSEFGWHFGGGAEIPLGERIKLTGDIRYVFLDYDFEGLPGRDIDSNFYMITVGILFRLF